jgi:predicted transporter
MESESIFLGLLFSLGVFALKGGAGLFYRIRRETGSARKALIIGLYSLTYLILIAGSGVVVGKWDVMRHFDVFTLFLRSGYLIHMVIAVGLALWGVYLLKRDPGSMEHSHAWLGLTVPCPMCLILLFVSVSFLLSYFPDDTLRVLVTTYAAFLGLSLFSMIVLTLWTHVSGLRPATVLGIAMLTAAAYFLISACVMPLYQDLDRVYRLALRPENTEIQSVIKPVFALVLSILFFISGGVFKRFGMGRPRTCK